MYLQFCIYRCTYSSVYSCTYSSVYSKTYSSVYSITYSSVYSYNYSSLYSYIRHSGLGPDTETSDASIMLTLKIQNTTQLCFVCDRPFSLAFPLINSSIRILIQPVNATYASMIPHKSTFVSSDGQLLLALTLKLNRLHKISAR